MRLLVSSARSCTGGASVGADGVSFDDYCAVLPYTKRPRYGAARRIVKPSAAKASE